MKGTDKRNEMDYLVRAWFFMNWEGRYTGLKEIFMGLAIDQFVGGSQSGLGSYKLLVDWVTNLHVIYIFSILQSAYLFVSLFLSFFFEDLFSTFVSIVDILECWSQRRENQLPV